MASFKKNKISMNGDSSAVVKVKGKGGKIVEQAITLPCYLSAYLLALTMKGAEQFKTFADTVNKVAVLKATIKGDENPARHIRTPSELATKIDAIVAYASADHTDDGWKAQTLAKLEGTPIVETTGKTRVNQDKPTFSAADLALLAGVTIE